MSDQIRRMRRLTLKPFERARLYNYEREKLARARQRLIIDTIVLSAWAIFALTLTLIALGIIR